MEYKEYILKSAHTPEFDAFLICLSHESILQYLDKIEQENLIKDGSGRLLVDQLTVTGNGQNRFLLLSFSNGKIDLESGEIIEPGSSYREHTSKSLSECLHFLENSILSDDEFKKIKVGEAL